MNKHRNFWSFFAEGWWWLLPLFAVMALVANHIWPEWSFVNCFFYCINMRMLFRAWDALAELWDRTEKLRDEDD